MENRTQKKEGSGPKKGDGGIWIAMLYKQGHKKRRIRTKKKGMVEYGYRCSIEQDKIKNRIRTKKKGGRTMLNICLVPCSMKPRYPSFKVAFFWFGSFFCLLFCFMDVIWVPMSMGHLRGHEDNDSMEHILGHEDTRTWINLCDQGVTLQIPPPSADFWKKTRGGGVSVKNFFIEDFLSKINFPALRAEKKGGGYL